MKSVYDKVFTWINILLNCWWYYYFSYLNLFLFKLNLYTQEYKVGKNALMYIIYILLHYF